MKVGIDARLAAVIGGIGHYAHDLVRALGQFGQHEYIAFMATNQDSSWIPEKVKIVRIDTAAWPVFSAHYQAAAQMRLAGCDLVHFPHLNVPLGYDRPFVATVHDLSIYRHPEWFAGGQWFSTRVVTPRAVKNAKRLIAISNGIADIIKQQFHTAEDRVKVIPNGVDTSVYQSGHDPHQDYVLYVGNVAPYKNIPLLNAVVKKLSIPCHIVGASKEQFQQVLNDPAPNFVFHQIKKFNDPELVDLYQHAKCVLQPSLYESFALPILEALACGTPVVAADIPSLRSIYGSAVSYAPLGDITAWKKSIEELKTQKQENDGAQMRSQVAQYSWRLLVDRLETLYSTAVT